MIEFKIITCPDKSQQANYQHLGSELTFGKSEGDMVVDDPGFGALQLRIKLEADKTATLENLNPSLEVRLNGKPINGIALLKEKDNLTVARTTINFSRLDASPLVPPERYEHPNARERFTPGSKEQLILDALAFLEQSSSDSGAAASPPPLPPGANASPPKPPLPGAGAAMPPPLPKKP